MAEVVQDCTRILEKMLENERFQDITIKLADGEVGAHKAVLTEVSEVFNSMLTSPMREGSSGIIEMPDTTVATMRVFLRLLYTGHIDTKDWAGKEGDHLPLQMLLAVAGLSRKYMAVSVHEAVVEALKGRLSTSLVLEVAGVGARVNFEDYIGCTITRMLEHGAVEIDVPGVGHRIAHNGEWSLTQVGKRKLDIECFQEILSGAIKYDLWLVRIAAAVLAAKSSHLQNMFNSRTLKPEVQAELQAVFSPVSPPSLRTKRPRLM